MARSSEVPGVTLFTREEILRPDVVEDLRKHACEAYPNECVGVITRSGYERLENTSDTPEKHARLDRLTIMKLIASGEVMAIAHSHPNGPNCPSAQDMASQIELAVPFVLISTNGQGCLPPLIWGDQVEHPPLDEPGFIHGIKDCYSRIRHFGFEHGFGTFDRVVLDDFPRDWQWWVKGGDLYRDNFQGQGWVDIPFEDRQPKDAVLMSIRSSVPNHAGILVERDVLYHLSTSDEPYEPRRCPQYRPLNNLKSFQPRCIRYVGKNTV